MARNFYYRLMVVSLVVLAVVFLTASVALLPAYFLSSVKKNLANLKLEDQKNEPMPPLDQRTLAEIKDLSGKLDIVESGQKNKFEVSLRVINQTVLHRMPGIKITQISYDFPRDDSPEGQVPAPEITVGGIAPSRERLLLFRQALEDDASFKKVNLPISNFVAGSNIKFSLTLIPN